MSIIRNMAGQLIPLGILISATDGAEITSAATVTIGKDGAASATGSGTLTYTDQWWYAPTQAETDADAIGIKLTKAGAVPVVVGVITSLISDKTGFSLTPTERTAIRTELETAGGKLALVQTDLATLAGNSSGSTGMTTEELQAVNEAAIVAQGVAKTSDLPPAPDNAGIAAIKTQTDRLGSVPVTVTSPMLNAARFEIVQGDDVSLAWTTAWAAATPTAAELRLMAYTDYQAGTGSPLLVTAGTVSVAAGILTVTVTLTAAETLVMPAYPSVGLDALQSQVALTLADGGTQTVTLARANVKKRIPQT